MTALRPDLEDLLSLGQHWVEIEWVVLPARHRSGNLPEDTSQVPYMARTRGLSEVQEPGTETSVLTATGRMLHGKIVSVRPGFAHSFGRPSEAWIELRESVRTQVEHGRPAVQAGRRPLPAEGGQRSV